MPWHVEARGGKFAVVADQGGKVMGTHDTKPEAEAQVRALYANVPEAREEAREGSADNEAEDAREHDRKMRSGGPTGMMRKAKKKKGFNPPMLPTPPGPHAP